MITVWLSSGMGTLATRSLVVDNREELQDLLKTAMLMSGTSHVSDALLCFIRARTKLLCM